MLRLRSLRVKLVDAIRNWKVLAVDPWRRQTVAYGEGWCGFLQTPKLLAESLVC